MQADNMRRTPEESELKLLPCAHHQFASHTLSSLGVYVDNVFFWMPHLILF
jgi:hypothetical protein